MPQNINIESGLNTKPSPPDGSEDMTGDVGQQVDDGREVLENFIFEHVFMLFWSKHIFVYEHVLMLFLSKHISLGECSCGISSW